MISIEHQFLPGNVEYTLGQTFGRGSLIPIPYTVLGLAIAIRFGNTYFRNPTADFFLSFLLSL